ncbi:tubulin polymerization-promoting protein homolog [Helicoverpa zea]|uniref:tubulin polymerization-promoting protein homolog n=1 Tax=Helicoverpa zea TaxID=7113 RepID=UPI001F5837B3|nr:tubulin polymerization-promoting protein homolog [Helicoverpa zea]
MDEEQATIESQFFAFAKLFESKTRTGETITLFHSDYWLRQASIIDDRKVTMTDTGILFNKYGKSEIDQTEWLEMITELCVLKQLDEPKTLELLINCGLPGETPVDIPMYRTFFGTYKSKNLLEGQTSVANKLAGQK